MSTGTPQAGDLGDGPPEHPHQPTAPTARWCRGHPHHLPSPPGVQKGFRVSVLCWSLCATSCPHPTAASPSRCPNTGPGLLPQPHNSFPGAEGVSGQPGLVTGQVTVWDSPTVGQVHVPLTRSQGTGTELVPWATLPTVHPALQHLHRRGCKIFLHLRIMAGQKVPRSPFSLPIPPVPSTL